MIRFSGALIASSLAFQACDSPSTHDSDVGSKQIDVIGQDMIFGSSAESGKLIFEDIARGRLVLQASVLTALALS
jgi:hypothetical protein